MKTLLSLFIILTISSFAAELPRDLGKIEEALKTTPDNPMLHYRKCQALFAAGKEQEAIDHAGVALEKFKAANTSLAWMLLGSITTKRYKIDVHFNMGAKERAEKKSGIVRPYSFRVWSKGKDSELVRVIDFEHAYMDGKILSAAVGESTGRGHLNFGVLDPKSDFATVKKKVLKILEK